MNSQIKRTMGDTLNETEVTTKKQKISKKTVQMLSDFDILTVKFLPIVKSSKCNLIPIRQPSNDSTILVQISGGGKVPPFGVKEKEDNTNKVDITLQIASENDYAVMTKVREHLVTLMDKNWTSWHTTTKKPSIEVIETLCNHFVHPKKPKKNNPNDFWDGLSNTSFNRTDLSSGKCRIVDIDTGDTMVGIDDLPGRTWHKAVFELKHVYILGTKSFGITKSLRYLSTSKQDDDDNMIVPL